MFINTFLGIKGFRLKLSHEMDEEGRIYLKTSLVKYEAVGESTIQSIDEFTDTIDFDRFRLSKYSNKTTAKTVIFDEFAKVHEIRIVKETPCPVRVEKELLQGATTYAKITNQDTVAIYISPAHCKAKRRPKIVCLFEA